MGLSVLPDLLHSAVQRARWPLIAWGLALFFWTGHLLTSFYLPAGPLAQGMAQGFTEGAQASVLPAVGQGVAAAAQAGRRALEGAFGGLGFAGWQPDLSPGDAAIRVAPAAMPCQTMPSKNST